LLSQSPAAAVLLNDDGRPLMKVLGAVMVVIVALYLADQEFAQGQYTDAGRQLGAQIMRSLGIT
jgi:hypothetical protein